MKIGLYPLGTGPDDVAAVREAERLGYHSIWSAESYGLDALCPMAWWAAQTTRIGLGTIVAVIDGRTPATAAMSAMTIDQLSNGRFTLGLGVSGPVVVEGWYGRPFAKPLARMREYVEIIRRIQAREGPVSYDGTFYTLPYMGPDSMRVGKALRSIHRPVRPHQPIFLAAEGPKAISLAAEIADGWTAFYISPAADAFYRRRLDEGFAQRIVGRPGEFEVLAQVHLAVDDDVERAADLVRDNIALFVGAMGHPSANFHHDALARIGFEAEVATIQKLWSAGDRKGAAASVPLRLVESLALVGPWDKIRFDLEAWKESCVSLLIPMVRGTEMGPALIAKLAELVLGE